MKKLPIVTALICACMLLPAVPHTAALADDIVPEKSEIVFYSGESAVSYYLDRNAVLYASGDNGNGELGIGTQGGKRYTPQKVMENVATVADGKSGFAVALTRDGRLFGWGKNEYAQLGQGTSYNEDTTTNRLLSPAEIALPVGSAAPKALAAGDSFTVVLTEDGTVLTCGRAGDGQTGIAGLTLTRKTVVGTLTALPQSDFGGEKVVAIDAAENTGFALTQSGKLYIWGANDRGILGSGSTDENEIYETPTLLDFPEPIAAVSAETMSAFILTESGDVYGWGDNSVGQLGVPEFSEVAAGSPVKLEKYCDGSGAETAITVKEILCGGRTNFVLSEAGDVYAFGAAGSGQAGCNLRNEGYLAHPNVDGSNVIRPTRVLFYAPVSLETATEEVLQSYQDRSPVDLTTPVTVRIASLVGSIGDRTFVLDEDGNMWSWGINLYGMASSGDALDCTAPVRSTLFRKENYDKEYTQKNYLIKPAVVMSLVVAFAAAYFIWAEIKIRRTEKKFAAEEAIRRRKAEEAEKT